MFSHRASDDSPLLRDTLVALGCAIVALGLLLWGGGIGESVGGGDLHGTYLSKYEYAARAASELRLPLWNRNEFCGIPLLGVAHGAVLYPPVVVLFASLPSWSALQMLYAVHVFILALGTIAYLRRRGIGRSLAALAVFLSLAGVFRGTGLVAVDHPSFLGCIAWFPMLLLCWERASRERNWRWTGLLTLVSGMQWLAGYPDFPLDTPVLLAILGLIDGRGSFANRFAVLTAALALGACLAALQLLPLAEVISQSSRAGHEALYAGVRAFFAASPAAVGLSLLDRFGAAACALAVLGLVCDRARSRVAWLVALTWALFALHYPLSLLYQIPPFSGVRFPVGWNYLAAPLLAWLSASGLHALWQRSARWARIAAVVLAVAASVHCVRTIARAPQSLRFGPPDLELVESRVHVLQAVRAQQSPTSRLISGPELVTGATLRYDLSSPTGYEPSLPPRRIWRLLNHLKLHVGGWEKPQDWGGVAGAPDVAGLLGVGVVVVERERSGPLRTAGFVPVGTISPGDDVLYRPPVPRARLVHRVAVVSGEEESFAKLVGTRAERFTMAIVEEEVLGLDLTEPPADVDEKAVIVIDEPEYVVIDALLASDGVLVLTDTFYPGWRAAVDGSPARIMRVDYAFRGVALQAGRHRVEFQYAPLSVRAGMAVSGTALVAILIMLFGRIPRPRRWSV